MSWIEPLDSQASDAWTPDEGLEQEPLDNVKIASSSGDSTFSGVKSALENKGVSTDRIRPSDIQKDEEEITIDGIEASEFDGSIFYRPNTWFNNLDDQEQKEKMFLMAELERDYDVNFFGGAESALLSRDKKKTKRAFESRGIEGVEDYSLDEAEEVLEEGEDIVAKPRNGTCQGECVELLESEEELERYVSQHVEEEDDVEEKLLLEEYLPTGEDSENHDMRMIVVGDQVYRRERTGGDGIANNLDNNGEYSDAPLMNKEELRLASTTQEIFGEGLYAVDYIRTEDGEIKVLENNATPGTKIENELDEDLKQDIADSMYQNTEATARPQTYSETAAVM